MTLSQHPPVPTAAEIEGMWRDLAVQQIAAKIRDAPQTSGSEEVRAIVREMREEYVEQRGSLAKFPLIRYPLNDESETPVRLEVTSHGTWKSCLHWTALYMYFTASGGLLYVGITDDFDKRDATHYDSSQFRKFAAIVLYKWFSRRYLAAECEWRLINEYRPPFNKTDQPDWKYNTFSSLVTPNGHFPHPFDDVVQKRVRELDVYVPHRLDATCWECASDRDLNALLNGAEVKTFNALIPANQCPRPRQHT